MENASKALLIAGGILILIILVSLILIVRNNVTNFYASQDELQLTADRAKFNEQFTRYNRDDVEGYELISLVNKIIDYNERVSSASNEGNDIQAEPITLKITLPSEEDIKNKIAYDKDIGALLIKKGNLVIKGGASTAINNASVIELIKISDEMKNIKNDIQYISGLTKKIGSIILTEPKLNRYLKYNKNSTKWEWSGKEYSNMSSQERENDIKNITEAINTFYNITGIKDYNITETDLKDTHPYNKASNKYKNLIDAYGTKMYEFYEYIQFTKAKFKCTKMDYSSSTGRVVNLEFQFTGEIE